MSKKSEKIWKIYTRVRLERENYLEGSLQYKIINKFCWEVLEKYINEVTKEFFKK